jgi:hypothetical protein
MTTPELILVGAWSDFPGVFKAKTVRRIVKPADVRSTFRDVVDGCWVASSVRPLRPLLDESPRARRETPLLLLGPSEEADREALSTRFRRVLLAGRLNLVPLGVLAEVLLSPQRDALFIGAVSSAAAQTVVLYTGLMQPLVVPHEWFAATGDGPRPDFDDVEVIDHGQTLRLGGYEAATEAVLYEFDASYRRRVKKLAVEMDTSFGGALRRLRLQRGLARSEFPGVSAKELARIEGGVVTRPHPRTLALLAKRLKVTVDEIGSY